MTSVRVEGFPSPGAETKMEAKAKEESEKTLADLGEDEREDHGVASGAAGSQELVGDVQLAVEEEPKEALHVKDMPAKENQTSVEREEHEFMGLVAYEGGVDSVRRQQIMSCLLYTSPSPRDRTRSRMPSSA